MLLYLCVHVYNVCLLSCVIQTYVLFFLRALCEFQHIYFLFLPQLAAKQNVLHIEES